MEIISKEIIKPSTPTPLHLRNLKLSFIDQIAPPIYVTLIFFYHYHQLNHHTNISLLLKQSLSHILTFFYPLAGRIQRDSSLNCNDSGAEFIEARVHTRLSETLKDPSMSELEKFQPLEPLGQAEKVVLAVKFSLFECGGIGVAIALSHKIADGKSLVAFVNACRGETNIVHPTFDFASLFPPRDMSSSGFTQHVGVTKEKIVTKRFVFDKDKVAELKKSAASDGVKDPTRVEVVSANIWRRFMEVAKVKYDTAIMLFAAVHAVNLRPTKRPPLSQDAFGNCWVSTAALLSEEENNDNYSDPVTRLRVSITSINQEFIKKLENGEYLNDLSRLIDDMYLKEGIELLNFCSWCRFGVYEVDFGWGKPGWVCTTTLPFKNVVILMDSPCGEGIEAWINVLQDDMEMFENHLLKSVS